MKSTLWPIVLALLPGISAAGQPVPVSDAELSLGGVAIGDTEEAVLATLGRPVRVVDTDDALAVRMDYDGLTVWLGEGRRVGEVLSTSPTYCTPAGACPGLAFARVVAKYGQAVVADREDGRFMEYPGTESACWLQVAVHGEVVASVRAECQP